MLGYINVFLGSSTTPYDRVATCIDFEITDLAVSDCKVNWPDVEAAIPIVSLLAKGSFSDGTERDFNFCLGVVAIEESVAHHVGAHILQRYGECCEVPAIPYLALQKLATHITGRSYPDAILAAVGTVSLLDTSPAESLLDLLTFMKKLPIDEPDEDVVEALCQRAAPSFEAAFAILPEQLASLRDVCEGRDHLEIASREITRVIEGLFGRRRRNLLFDLECFLLDDPPEKSFWRFVREVPPCDVIVLSEGTLENPEAGRIVSFQGFASSQEAAVSLRALQSQSHYMNFHLDGLGKTIAATSGRSIRCPYFACCTLEWRRTDPADCRERPWVLSNKDPLYTCWYGLGVRGTRGVTKALSMPERES